MSGGLDRLEHLARFQAKAGCRWTQQAACHAWNRLRLHLTLAQRRRLTVAWQHAKGDEGRAELDDVCGELRAEWGA